MTIHSDMDYAAMLVQRPQGGVRYGQGELLSWNPETFENVVLYKGRRLENLPVKAGTDALSWVAGQSVELKIIDADGAQGVTQIVIDGRIITPGEGNAEQIIDFMRGNLARQIATQIFAENVHFSPILAPQIQRTSTSWGDPDSGGDPGPTIEDVHIATGTAIVFLTANSNAGTEFSNQELFGGYMGVRVTGPENRSPDQHSYLGVRGSMAVINAPGPYQMGINVTPTVAALITGLPEGDYTFHAQYRSLNTDQPCYFAARHMFMIAL